MRMEMDKGLDKTIDDNCVYFWRMMYYYQGRYVGRALWIDEWLAA